MYSHLRSQKQVCPLVLEVFSAPYNDSAWRGFSINADWSASPETTELTKRKFKQINENARQVLSMSECQYLFI